MATNGPEVKRTYAENYKALCVFCEQHYTFDEAKWMSHLISHTGKLPLKCKVCGQHFERENVHLVSDCKCDSDDIVSVYESGIDTDSEFRLDAYACFLCNYIQMEKENISLHVRDSHDFKDLQSDEFCRPITLLAISAAVKLNVSGKLVNTTRSSPATRRANPPKTNAPLAEDYGEGLSMIDMSHIALDRGSPRVSLEIMPSLANLLRATATSNGDDAVPSTSQLEARAENLSNELTESEITGAAAVGVKVEPMGMPSNDKRCGSISLKPWTISHHSSKSNGIAFDMLRDTCMFSLFKCMARVCRYATPDAGEMQKHLDGHSSSNVDQGMESTDHLECAYCMVVAPSSENLVDHIVIVHSESRFQCQHCFYRSADAYSVQVHLSLHHKGEEAVILFCDDNRNNREYNLAANITSKLTNKMLKPIISDGKCLSYPSIILGNSRKRLINWLKLLLNG